MRDIQGPLVRKCTCPRDPMATTDNLAKVLANFPRGEGPLYQQLVQTITLAVERSDLLPGTRLPPERTLAKALKLSRTTVVQAYARLREAGTIESRHGRISASCRGST